MPTLLYQQNNVEMTWDEKEKWLYVRWMGPQTVSEIQRDWEQMLRFIIAKNVDSILSDNTNVEGGWISATHWSKEWIPQVRKAGLKYLAWVHSEDRVSQIPADANTEISSPGNTKVFTSALEAVTWLRTQRKRDAARTQRIVLPPELRRR